MCPMAEGSAGALVELLSRHHRGADRPAHVIAGEYPKAATVKG